MEVSGWAVQGSASPRVWAFGIVESARATTSGVAAEETLWLGRGRETNTDSARVIAR